MRSRGLPLISQDLLLGKNSSVSLFRSVKSAKFQHECSISAHRPKCARNVWYYFLCSLVPCFLCMQCTAAPCLVSVGVCSCSVWQCRRFRLGIDI